MLIFSPNLRGESPDIRGDSPEIRGLSPNIRGTSPKIGGSPLKHQETRNAYIVGNIVSKSFEEITLNISQQ